VSTCMRAPNCHILSVRVCGGPRCACYTHTWNFSQYDITSSMAPVLSIAQSFASDFKSAPGDLRMRNLDQSHACYLQLLDDQCQIAAGYISAFGGTDMSHSCNKYVLSREM
jgi:hypothetical protein